MAWGDAVMCTCDVGKGANGWRFCRSALPWEDYEDDVGQDQNELVNSAPTADTEDDGAQHSRPCMEPFRLEPRSDSLHPLSPNPPSGNSALAHVKVRRLRTSGSCLTASRR